MIMATPIFCRQNYNRELDCKRTLHIHILFQLFAIFLQGGVYFHISGHVTRCRTVSKVEDSRFVPTHIEAA